jgi:hypothetical protein
MKLKKTQYVIVVFLIIIGCKWYLTKPVLNDGLTKEGEIMIDKLFESEKKQCIGRYFFKVPISFDNDQLNQVWINDIRISSKKMYPPAFEQRVRLREKELKFSSTVSEIDKPFLKEIHRINESTVIFDRNENESVPGFGRILEGHVYSNGIAFILKVKIRDLSDEKYKKDKDDYIRTGTLESELSNKFQRLNEMRSLIKRLSGRKDAEVPSLHGLCIPFGFIKDDTSEMNEKISLRYDLEDFTISVNNYNTSGQDVGLLERDNEINSALKKMDASTLKKGKVVFSSMNGEEWLIKGKQEIFHPENKTLPSYTFNFYVSEKTSDNNLSILSLELHNSGKENKSYTDEQLIEIWNRLTRSFSYEK